MVDDTLRGIVRRTVDGRKVFGAVVSMSTGDGRWRFDGSAGNLEPATPFFIASVTKLYVTAIVMQLRQAGRLDLDDRLVDHLGAATVEGLSVQRGVDHSRSLTIRHLLAHTSGLADYLGDKGPDGRRLVDALTAGRDRAWTFDDILRDARAMAPKFLPGTAGKAHYSDTNYQLLGRLIEVTTSLSIADAVQRFVCEPLGLRHTYMYVDAADTRPTSLYFKHGPLQIPLAMASVTSDGGIVSTSGELLAFLESFFQGRLFPGAYLGEMKRWNRIFFPLEYGVGVSRFKVPWIFMPFGSRPELIGHSGLSGAFAFFAPERGVYLAGTVNQVHGPQTSFRLMLQLLAAVRRYHVPV